MTTTTNLNPCMLAVTGGYAAAAGATKRIGGSNARSGDGFVVGSVSTDVQSVTLAA